MTLDQLPDLFDLVGILKFFERDQFHVAA